MALNQRNKIVLTAYAGGMSSAEAYLQAYPKAKDPSGGCFKLLQREECQKFLEKKEKEVLRQAGLSAVRTIKEVCALAFADCTEAFEMVEITEGEGEEQVTREVMRFRSLNDMPEEVRKSISSIKQLRNGGVQVTFYSKTTALDKLMRHQGLFEKDNEQAGQRFSFVFGGAKSQPVHAESDIVDPIDARKESSTKQEE